jgi:hypothetical protein
MNSEVNSQDYHANSAQVEIESEFEDMVPDDFKRDPFLYFEMNGTNIKSGEVKYDEAGVIREDPTAVKDLPVWEDISGNTVHPVGKKVNTQKAMIGESADPFYEYKIMEYVRSKGFPAARPIAKASRGNEHLIVMEKLAGVRWSEKDSLHLNEQGYTKEDIERLISEANAMMEQLQSKFEEAGIKRGWKLKDMVFDLDIENKKIRAITPTDWERTKIVAKK